MIGVQWFAGARTQTLDRSGEGEPMAAVVDNVSIATAGNWPSLPYREWRATRDTLHMYTQVIGKVRLALSPFEPQWANVPFYVTARGLTTSTIPVGLSTIDAEFDLIDHVLVVRSSNGHEERRPLGGSVADFYSDVLRILKAMNVEVDISTLPSEVHDPIRFSEDSKHHTYDAGHALRFFQVLSTVDIVMKEYHAAFQGRTSPVQFFWGTFDLSVARYSGRPVTPPPDAPVIRRFGGDAEAICAGFWPGDERFTEPAFFAYGYPAPAGIERSSIQPSGAHWDPAVREFMFPYEAVRAEKNPGESILRFLDSAYASAAALMDWEADLTKVSRPPRSHAAAIGGAQT